MPSLSPTKPDHVDRLPFVFPRVVLNAYISVFSPSLTELGWLSLHALQLSAKTHTCYLQDDAQGKSHGKGCG